MLSLSGLFSSWYIIAVIFGLFFIFMLIKQYLKKILDFEQDPYKNNQDEFEKKEELDKTLKGEI